MFQDNFKGDYVFVKDGQISPNKLWKCVYGSYGGKGAVGARPVSVPVNKHSGNVMYLRPKAPEGTGTCSALVLSEQVFTDFDMTFYMRTLSHTRTSKPNGWETAWIMWRYSDDKLPSGKRDKHHHYYMYIGTSGMIEVGKKDYELYDGGLITPDGKRVPGDQEQQQYLTTEAKVSFALKKWFKVRIIAQSRNIKIYVDDVMKVNIVDDGKIGKDGATNKRPLGYMASDKMLKGKIGFYSEDAAVEFDNITVSDYPL